MGKSSGSTQTQKVEPWSGQKPYLEDIYGQAKQLGSTPLQYYPGTTYAGMSGTTKAGLANMTSLAQQGSPQLNAALNGIGGIAAGGTNQNITTAGNQLQNLFNSGLPVGSTTMNTLSQMVKGSTPGQDVLGGIMRGTNPAVAGLLQAGQGNTAGQKTLASIMNGGGAGMDQLEQLMKGGGAGMGALNSIINGSDAGMQGLEGILNGQNSGMQMLDMAANGSMGGQDVLKQIMQGQGLGMDTLTKTASGEFLNSNPYLDKMYGNAARQVTDAYKTSTVPNTDALFSRSGALGSGSNYFKRAEGEDALSRGLGDMAANLYGTNYANERGLMQQAGLALPGIQQGAADSLTGSQLTGANAYAGLMNSAGSNYAGLRNNAGQAYAGLQNSAGQAYTGNQQSAAGNLISSMLSGNQGAGSLMGSAAGDLINSQQAAAGQVANIGFQDRAQRIGLANDLASLGLNQQGQQMQAAGQIPGLMDAQYNPSRQLLAAGDILNQNKQNTINDLIGRWDFAQNEPMQRLSQYSALIQGSNPGKTVTERGGGGSWGANFLGGAQAGAGLGYELSGGLKGWTGVGGLLGGLLMSDRNAKEGFTSIDPADALDAVRRMPVSAWRYKPGHNDNEPHIGPMAQDFQEATGLGDGRTIHAVDAIGVCLAAIQALAGRQDATDAKLDRILAKLAA